MKTESGQSLIEVIFSITVVVLVVTGVIALIISTISIKTTAFQRKTAGNMADVVVENLVNQQKNNTETFWSLTNITGQTLANFDVGYTYSVALSQISGNGCSVVVKECANALVTVSWGNNQNLTVNRFFSRKN
jgi:Tfp pilus assembly protein PilV